MLQVGEHSLDVGLHFLLLFLRNCSRPRKKPLQQLPGNIEQSRREEESEGNIAGQDDERLAKHPKASPFPSGCVRPEDPEANPEQSEKPPYSERELNGGVEGKLEAIHLLLFVVVVVYYWIEDEEEDQPAGEDEFPVEGKVDSGLVVGLELIQRKSDQSLKKGQEPQDQSALNQELPVDWLLFSVCVHDEEVEGHPESKQLE